MLSSAEVDAKVLNSKARREEYTTRVQARIAYLNSLGTWARVATHGNFEAVWGKRGIPCPLDATVSLQGWMTTVVVIALAQVVVEMKDEIEVGLTWNGELDKPLEGLAPVEFLERVPERALAFDAAQFAACEALLREVREVGEPVDGLREAWSTGGALIGTSCEFPADPKVQEILASVVVQLLGVAKTLLGWYNAEMEAEIDERSKKYPN